MLLRQSGRLLALPLLGARTPILVREVAAGVIDQARFSPDGRLIAYHHRTGPKQLEVYLERFPPAGERLQVSAEGGAQPVWREDSRELYYLGRDATLFAVAVDGATFDAGKPRPLFRLPIGKPTQYATIDTQEQYATVDGNRFLVLKPVASQPRPINVIVNWPALIQERSRR